MHITMNAFPIILVVLFSFCVFFLAFLALSSCLGDDIRAAWSGGRRNRSMPTTYGLQYARFLGQGGHSGHTEHIEMENMMDRWGQGQEDD